MSPLVVWSFGFLCLLYGLIRRHKGQPQDFEVMVPFGFFYSDFVPSCWWWELLVMRMDALGVRLVTCFSFPDAKVTRATYGLIASMVRSCHLLVEPLGHRSNRLADRTGAVGHVERFSSCV